VMYQELAERAEITQTEVKLLWGKKQTVFEQTWDPIVPQGPTMEGEGTWMRTRMTRTTSEVILTVMRSSSWVGRLMTIESWKGAGGGQELWVSMHTRLPGRGGSDTSIWSVLPACQFLRVDWGC
jgi:hypothetical protein